MSKTIGENRALRFFKLNGFDSILLPGFEGD